MPGISAPAVSAVLRLSFALPIVVKNALPACLHICLINQH
jgi:hypothetical protein